MRSTCASNALLNAATKSGRLNVRLWPIADMSRCTAYVRFEV
jgi:hypothetical protein